MNVDWDFINVQAYLMMMKVWSMYKYPCWWSSGFNQCLKTNFLSRWQKIGHATIPIVIVTKFLSRWQKIGHATKNKKTERKSLTLHPNYLHMEFFWKITLHKNVQFFWRFQLISKGKVVQFSFLFFWRFHKQKCAVLLKIRIWNSLCKRILLQKNTLSQYFPPSRLFELPYRLEPWSTLSQYFRYFLHSRLFDLFPFSTSQSFFLFKTLWLATFTTFQIDLWYLKRKIIDIAICWSPKTDAVSASKKLSFFTY